MDEGNLWRAIQRAVSAFLSDLAALEVRSGDEDEEAPTPGVREDAAPVPRDAETRFQLARARQEEWKLRRMQREHADLAKATRRLAAFRRRVLDQLAGWVPRVAPTIAAEVGAEAAPLAHAMARHLGPLRADLAAVDVAAGLRRDPPEEGDDGEGEAHEHDETETGDRGVADRRPRATPPPRAGRAPRRGVSGVPRRDRTRRSRRG